MIVHNNVILKSEKKATSLNTLYMNWRRHLIEKVIRIYEWTGLPFPQKEIEMILMLIGFGVFTYDNLYKGYVCAPCSLSGVTPFPDIFTTATFSAPGCRGGNLKIGSSCLVFENNSLRLPVIDVIEKYASLLSHAEITLKTMFIGSREFNTYTAPDDTQAKNINEWYTRLYNGELKAITTPQLTSLLAGDKAVVNVANQYKSVDFINMIDAINAILRRFYQEFGVRCVRDKKANMIAEEVEDNTQMLLFNISDMTKYRKSFAEQVNELYPDLSISVKLSPEFDYIDKEVERDDDN